jgi:phage FluMu protein Com
LEEDVLVDISKNLRCPDCGKVYEATLTADAVVCPHCQHRVSRVDQVQALLEEWYYPRRWNRDVDRPRARFLIERLWQQQFDPHELYEQLAPKETNFEVFCYTVTRVTIKGIEGGWAKLDLPEDPLADDPIYKLQILDLERFTEEMEKALPDVNWDEDIEVVGQSSEPAPEQQEGPSA